jgi:hypothetical protein
MRYVRKKTTKPIKNRRAIRLDFPVERINKPPATEKTDVNIEIIIANRRGEELRMS